MKIRPKKDYLSLYKVEELLGATVLKGLFRRIPLLISSTGQAASPSAANEEWMLTLYMMNSSLLCTEPWCAFLAAAEEQLPLWVPQITPQKKLYFQLHSHSALLTYNKTDSTVTNSVSTQCTVTCKLGMQQEDLESRTPF